VILAHKLKEKVSDNGYLFVLGEATTLPKAFYVLQTFAAEKIKTYAVFQRIDDLLSLILHVQVLSSGQVALKNALQHSGTKVLHHLRHPL